MAELTPKVEEVTDVLFHPENREQAKQILGWKPRFSDLHEIVRTAFDWHNAIAESGLRQAAAI